MYSIGFNFGKIQHHFDELPSTNEWAIDLLSKTNPTEGTVISTDFQTHGKGQIGRSWHASPCKNLLFSTILRPNWLPTAYPYVLNMAMALSLYDAILSFGYERISLKWPNDLYIDNRKLAGMLVQLQWEGKSIKSAVVGIGLNVGEDQFPDDLPNPAALWMCSDQELPERKLILEHILRRMEQRYAQLYLKQYDLILRDYTNALYLRDQEADYTDLRSEENFRGIIRQVSTDGRIHILDVHSGDIRVFEHGMLKYPTYKNGDR